MSLVQPTCLSVNSSMAERPDPGSLMRWSSPPVMFMISQAISPEPPDPPDPPDFVRFTVVSSWFLRSFPPSFHEPSMSFFMSSMVSSESSRSPSAPPCSHPQVCFYSSQSDPSMEWFRNWIEGLALVLGSSSLISLVLWISLMVGSKFLPFDGFSIAHVRFFTAICRFGSVFIELIGSLMMSHVWPFGHRSPNVDTLLSGNGWVLTFSVSSLRITSISLSLLPAQALFSSITSLTTDGCEINIGLDGNDVCYVNICGVTTLPCIEVCFRQVLVIHFAKGLVPFICYDVYYLEFVRFATLFQSSLACRFVASALVVSSLAIKKVMFSPKVSLAMSGLVAQDSSVLQGISSRFCLSSAFGAVSLALLAIEDFVLLLASGEMKNGVHQAYGILFDIESLLGSFIKYLSIYHCFNLVTICMVFVWASMAFCRVFVTLLCIFSSFNGV